MNKKLLTIPLAAGVIAVATGIYANQVFANGRNFDNHPLMAKIAGKFNLDENELNTFLQEERGTRQAEMQQRFVEKLDGAVADGNLTAEQKELILQKHEEMKNQRPEKPENWHELSQEERQAGMEERRAKHDELEAWLEENGISEEYFGLGGGEGMKHKGQGSRAGWKK